MNTSIQTLATIEGPEVCCSLGGFRQVFYAFDKLDHGLLDILVLYSQDPLA
jgi:hypothetical protein